MAELQGGDENPENDFSSSTSANLKSANYYYNKSKTASSMKLDSVKENTNMTINLGIERLVQDPKQKRRRIKNGYVQPCSGRESWWRSTIKETPLPGSYNIPSFLAEVYRKPNTYRFKSDGRRIDPTPQIGKGEYLLPGAYAYEDFGSRLKRLNVSYGFKNSVPIDKTKLGMEPSLNVSPASYDTTKYLNIDAPVESVRHSMFKSREKRQVFVGKEGMGPDAYSPIIPDNKKEITSCFKSESSRFRKFNTIAPGPGTYEPISTWINSKQSQQFSTKGVFFTPSSKVTT